MGKHTQTIRRQQPTNCLSVFDHFVNLALKGLKTFNEIVLDFLPVESKTNILYVNFNFTGNLPLGFGRYCVKYSQNPLFFTFLERLHTQMFFQYFTHVGP